MAIFTHFIHMWTLCGHWDKICILGRAFRTKKTLPDFHKRCRVTRHPRVFPRVDGLSTNPWEWGVIRDLQKARSPRLTLGPARPDPMGFSSAQARPRPVKGRAGPWASFQAQLGPVGWSESWVFRPAQKPV